MFSVTIELCCEFENALKIMKLFSSLNCFNCDSYGPPYKATVIHNAMCTFVTFHDSCRHFRSHIGCTNSVISNSHPRLIQL